jgi:hypothetical protein
MSTPHDVYGIELHITDAPESITADDVQAGDLVAGLNGTISFSEVNGEIIALWFSLTGDYIPAGSSGRLFDVDFTVDDDAPNGTVEIDFTNQTTFSDGNGQSMYWGYEGTTIEVGLPEVYLSLNQISDDQYEIHMANMDVVSGFQFTISDNPNNLSFVSVEGSSRVPADWSMSGNDVDGGSVLLGFSFQGSTIAAGDGAIVDPWKEKPSNTLPPSTSFPDIDQSAGTLLLPSTDTNDKLLGLSLIVNWKPLTTSIFAIWISY